MRSVLLVRSKQCQDSLAVISVRKAGTLPLVVSRRALLVWLAKRTMPPIRHSAFLAIQANINRSLGKRFVCPASLARSLVLHRKPFVLRVTQVRSLMRLVCRCATVALLALFSRNEANRLVCLVKQASSLQLLLVFFARPAQQASTAMLTAVLLVRIVLSVTSRASLVRRHAMHADLVNTLLAPRRISVCNVRQVHSVTTRVHLAASLAFLASTRVYLASQSARSARLVTSRRAAVRLNARRVRRAHLLMSMVLFRAPSANLAVCSRQAVNRRVVCASRVSTWRVKQARPARFVQPARSPTQPIALVAQPASLASFKMSQGRVCVRNASLAK